MRWPDEASVGANGAEARLFIENRERVEAVLGVKRFDGGSCAQRHSGDPPSRIFVQQAIDVIRLMSTMESSRAEMNDAGGEAVAVCWGAQRVTPRFQMAISRSPLRSASVASPEATLVISESSSFELASTPS